MAASKDTKKEPSPAAAAAASTAGKSSESAATAATPTAKKMVPRKALPSIGHMLVHGAPESEGRPKTWAELIGFPLVLLIVFIISFYIFLNSPPSRYPPGRYRLPQNKMPASMMKDALAQKHQQASEATPKTEVKEEF